MGIRVSVQGGSYLALGPFQGLAAAQATLHLRDALVALIVDKDANAAEKHLQKTEGKDLPKSVEAFRWMVTALIYLNRNRTGPALEAMNKAHALRPDMPCLDLFKGIAYNNLTEWTKALKHLEAYRELLGDDVNVCREIGVALSGLNRHPEACVSFRKALEYDPRDVELLLSLLRSMGPNDKRDELGTRFAKLRNPHASFEILAQDCRDARDGQGLEPIALAMRKIDPKYIPAHFHLALAQAWNGRAVEAVQSFKVVMARETDAAKRSKYATQLLPALAQAGQGVEVYALAPDAWEAFRLRGGGLLRDYHLDELKRLATIHARKHPFDLLLPLYWGEVYAYEGQHLLADKAFTAGLAVAPEAVPLEPFRASRVLARYHTGRALSAYADIGPRQETMNQLAYLCFQDRKYDLLKSLLDAHDKDQPNDPSAWPIAIGCCCIKTACQKGLPCSRRRMAKQDQPQQRKQMLSTFLIQMVDVGKSLEGYRAAPGCRGGLSGAGPRLAGPGPVGRLAATPGGPSEAAPRRSLAHLLPG